MDLTQYCSHRDPFTLSLSKGREQEGFDKLSPNGKANSLGT
jgi:hypothetical protein